jgi:hypothetical protein
VAGDEALGLGDVPRFVRGVDATSFAVDIEDSPEQAQERDERNLRQKAAPKPGGKASGHSETLAPSLLIFTVSDPFPMAKWTLKPRSG